MENFIFYAVYTQEQNTIKSFFFFKKAIITTVKITKN